MPLLKNIDLILIVGAQKSGTSSLHKYLSDHDEILSSTMKQTFYFMPDEFYDLNKSKVFKKYSENTDDFLSLFPPINSSIKAIVESTPDYLHTPGVIERIMKLQSHFRNVFIIAILRHPVERFISWHRFAIQQGTINSDMSLDEFYRLNKPICSAFKDTDSCFFAKESGKYELFLRNYFNAFGKNLAVFSFDLLQNNPRELMTALCGILKLDDSLYGEYNFGVKNKTIKVRSRLIHKIYMKVRIVYILLMKTPLRRMVTPIRNLVSRLYHRVNDSTRRFDSVNEMSTPIKKELFDIYARDINYCNLTFGFSWKTNGDVK